MKDHNQHKFKGIFKGFIHQLLQVDLIRYLISRIRFIWYVKILGRLKTQEGDVTRIAKNTIMHNLKGLKDYAAVRPLAMIKPLSVIESLSVESKILCIGPRTEGEILALIGYGFLRRNITGLDLISYSPWVKTGDMHDMSFEDNTFDVVFAGWVIAYSNDPKQAAKEMIRVLKPGGIIAIGVEYAPSGMHDDLGYVAGAGRETSKTTQITQYFENSIDHIYFNHEIIADRQNVKGSVIALFSIKK